MSRPVRDDEEVPVEGFEIPSSPDSSYDYVYEFDEDEEKKGVPIVPLHLPMKIIKKCPPNMDPSEPLPVPLKISMNHVYVDDTNAFSSVVGLGLIHRYRSKFVNVLVYTPFAPVQPQAPSPAPTPAPAPGRASGSGNAYASE